ncbi:MAG: PilZ domain-containing protein [Bacteriovoracaceae bacterium]|nr:PilZ domain-containing protein [Bacteriovoracaceae bacterium]
MGLFTLMVPSLVASYAIFSVKNWSYPVFLTAMAWIFIHSIFRINSDFDLTTKIFGIIIPMAFNVYLVSYFLIPSVKTTYYEPKIRWWEASPRYIVDLSTKIYLGDEFIIGRTCNISNGGALLDAGSIITIGKDVRLEFELNNQAFSIDAKSIFKAPHAHFYGFQFQNISRQLKKDLEFQMMCLKDIGCEVTRPLPHWRDDFKKWLKHLLKTGEGVTPKLPEE